MGSRREARECALQMLYQFDVGHQAPRDILATYWNMNERPAKVQTFATQLFEGSLEQLEAIDAMIRRHAQNWKIVRMAAVDRNILRVAVFEFLTGELPESVIIDEALEIAKKFSTSESSLFVNGVLDSIIGELKARSGEGTA